MNDKWKLSCVIETQKHQLYKAGVLRDEHDYTDRIVFPTILESREDSYTLSVMIDIAYKLQAMINEHIVNSNEIGE